MPQSEIESRIPHRPPMLLLDEIVSESEDQIVCRKTFRADEYFFAGHYPDNPIVPGVILCESAMQAGAVLLSKHLGDSASGVPVATRINNVKLKKIVVPGDTITIEVSLSERLADAFFLNAKVTVDGKVTTRFDFACTVAVPH